MSSCPRCGRHGGQLHLLPPAVLTKKLVIDMGGPEGLDELRVCGRCIEELMEVG